MSVRLIPKPARVAAAGTKPKLIDEYIGRVNSETKELSVAHMRSPGGWIEPGQTPEFDEYTVVLKGVLRVEHKSGTVDVAAGQAVVVPGENGSDTAPLSQMAPNTLRFAAQPSRSIRSTATTES